MHRCLSSALLLSLALCAAACGGGSPTGPSGSPGSSSPSQTSHNAGRDCVGCHSFTVAGTVYRSDGTGARGATIRITTARAGGGTTVLSLTADASGNFYSGASLSFGSGLYTDATGGSGTTRAMEATITSGACNRCHTGSSRIVAD